MKCFKSVLHLLAGQLTLLTVVAAISVCTMGIKPAEASVTGQVVISEFFYDEDTGRKSELNEFVELYNPTDIVVDISGWRLEHYNQSGKLQKREP